MPIRFTFRQLEYFVAVGQAGSIAAASERINVSSPSISAAIAQLEREFGVQLFVRQHAQGLSLTPGGRRFFNQATLLLEQAGALHELASDIVERVRGPISVGCLVTLAPLVLPELRRRFEQAYPEASVSQVEAHQADLLAMLRRAEIDIAITYDLAIPQDIAFQPLAELPPYALVAADHPLAALPAVSLERLAAEPLVLLDLPMSREYFLSLFQQQGLSPTIAERSPQFAMVHSMVANGFGYALANIRPRVERAPDGKPLKLLPLAGAYRPMTLGAATVRAAHKSRLLAAFEAHCRSAISDAAVPGMATGGP